MKRFKIAVAGCGSMANEWLKYALSLDEAEIVALVDIKEENAAGMKEKYSLSCGIYTDIAEAIRHSGANLVFDVTIPASHRDIVVTSLELGCDVLGEKPMAASINEAVEMVSMAKKCRKSYAVMQNRRYLKNIRAFRDLIQSGIIGQPGFICSDFFLGPHFGGFRDVMDSPLLLDMAIHTFDQARFITGSDPVSAYCHEFNPAGSWYKGNASAVCIFEFSNGSVFCYRGSWCAVGLNTSWESSWRVTGSSGTAVWDGINAPFCEIKVPSNNEKSVYDFRRIDAELNWDGREGHFGCFDEMFDALKNGRKAETDCSDNIKSLAMVFAALESVKRGCRVRIEI